MRGMTAVRELRRSADLSQQELATLLAQQETGVFTDRPRIDIGGRAVRLNSSCIQRM
jgi:hypothetical protein